MPTRGFGMTAQELYRVGDCVVIPIAQPNPNPRRRGEPSSPVNARFDVNPRWVLWTMLVMIAGQAAAALAIEVLRFGFGHDTILGLIPFFDFDKERSVPSWYSSTQLALAAVILTAVTLRKFDARDGQRFLWALLAMGFWYLSLDERAEIHEHWSLPNQSAYDITRGFLTFGWVLIAIPLIAALGLLFSRFVFRLPRRTRNAVIGSGALYVCSAVGVEVLQGVYYSTYRVKDFGFHMIVMVEETGEMLGIALFIFALLRYVHDEATAATAVSSPTR